MNKVNERKGKRKSKGGINGRSHRRNGRVSELRIEKERMRE